MKNLRSSITQCIAVAALLIAGIQTAGAQTGEFGIRYMPTFSAFDMQTSDGNTIQGTVTLGHGVGVTGAYHFNDYVGVQAEVIYNSFSQKYSEMDIDHKVNMQYLNIPLLISLNTGKSKFFNVNIVAGPQIGIRVGSRVTSSSEGTMIAQPLLMVKKADLGLAYGAGFDVGLNEARTLRLGLGFRGVFGLIDISDHSSTLTTDNYYVLDRTNMETYSGYIGFSILF